MTSLTGDSQDIVYTLDRLLAEEGGDGVLGKTRREGTAEAVCGSGGERTGGGSSSVPGGWDFRSDRVPAAAEVLDAVEEQSRRPHKSPNKTAGQVEQRVIDLRKARPDWGAPKLQVLLK